MTIYDFKLPAERIKTLETEITMYENYKKDLDGKEAQSVLFFINHHNKIIQQIKNAISSGDEKLAIYYANYELLIPEIVKEVAIRNKMPQPGTTMSWATYSAEEILKEMIRAIFK